MKKVIATIISIAVFAGALYGADFILKDRTDHGVKQSLAMYSQPRDSVDLLMLGSSHIHYGVNVAKLWTDYGISAYDYSSAEQPTWISYYYLKEACKTQKPKVVMLDFFTPAAFQDDYKNKYMHLSESMNGFKFNLNKIQMMWVSFDGDKEAWNKYFPSFFGYHDRYDKLEDEDFEAAAYDYANFKGYTPYFEQYPQSVPGFSLDEVKPPSDKSIEYLDKIVEYTAANDIELYITMVPYWINGERVMNVVQEEDDRYNWLVKYVEEKNEEGYDNVCFDYTFTHMEDIGIDYESGWDMIDPSHLSYYGSCKYTGYLGDTLRDKYGEDVLPDHRGDDYYSSWDTNAEELRERVEEEGYEWR